MKWLLLALVLAGCSTPQPPPPAPLTPLADLQAERAELNRYGLALSREIENDENALRESYDLTRAETDKEYVAMREARKSRLPEKIERMKVIARKLADLESTIEERLLSTP